MLDLSRVSWDEVKVSKTEVQPSNVKQSSVMGFRQLNAIAAENPDLRDLRFTSVH